MKLKDCTYVSNPTEIDGVRVENDIFQALNAVLDGEEVMRYERGSSMEPILHDGEYALLKPIESIDEVNVGDAVFCKVHNYLMTHMVVLKSYRHDKPYFLIGSSSYDLYGWTDKIYAKALSTNVIEIDEESLTKSVEV